jgi:hypothetical protein
MHILIMLTTIDIVAIVVMMMMVMEADNSHEINKKA